MIWLKFSIENPWWEDRWASLWNKAGSTPFKHKYWEVQVMKDTTLIAFDFRVNTRCDHAGVDLLLGLFGYTINAQVYDNRHWNYEEGKFYE